MGLQIKVTNYSRINSILYRYTPFISAILGLVGFLVMCGYRILDPLYYQWLLSGDKVQHFMGWEFFRYAPWHFPLGYMQALGYPTGTSIVYTDSIPLVAIPLKLFSPLLPRFFQYSGLWICLSFILQGYFASKLLKKITDNFFIVLLGSIFFIYSPTFLQKEVFNGWEAMGSLWLVLAALYLYFLEIEFKTHCKWIVLLALTICIHFYVYGMVFFIFLAYLWKVCRHTDTKSLITAIKLFFIAGLVTLIIMWIIGYFAISLGSGAAPGFGSYSMNLNEPFNPWIYPALFFKPLPLSPGGQGEGFNYLGLGLLILIMFAVYEFCGQSSIRHYVKRHYLPLLTVATMLFLYSLSNKIYFGPHLIASIPLPSFLLNHLFPIYRASGRMFAPAGYIIILLSIAIIIKANSGKQAMIVILLLVSIQLIDLSPTISNFKPQSEPPSLPSPIWTDMGKNISHIDFLPANNWPNEIYISFTSFAVQYQLTMNTFNLSRFNQEKRNQYNAILMQTYEKGNLKEDTLYVWNPWPASQGCVVLKAPPGFIAGQVDGYWIIVSKKTVPKADTTLLKSCIK